MLFDKKIKEKIDNYNPDLEPGAWDKFNKLLPLPWYVSFWKTYSGLFIGTFSTMIFCVMSYLLYNEKMKNKLLENKVVVIIRKLNKVNSDKIIVKQIIHDTVYRVKFIEHPIFIASKDDNSLKQNIKIPEFTFQTNKKEEVQIRTNHKTSLETNETTKESGLNKNEFTTQTEQKNALDSKVVLNSNLGKNDAEDVIDTEKKQEVSKSTNLPIRDFLKSSEEKDLLSKTKLKLPKIKARFGVNTDYIGFNLFSNGPTTEVFLAKKMSVGIGVLITSPQKATFENSLDFTTQTGTSINTLIPSDNLGLPVSVVATNIKTETSLLKVPISFNYYYALNKSFDFILSSGTKLDVNVYQTVKYDQIVFGIGQKENFEKKIIPKIFNNLNYGLGLQYKHRRLVWQFTPYFDFYFRSSYYFTPMKNFGINSSLKYEIGK